MEIWCIYDLILRMSITHINYRLLLYENNKFPGQPVYPVPDSYTRSRGCHSIDCIHRLHSYGMTRVPDYQACHGHMNAVYTSDTPLLQAAQANT